MTEADATTPIAGKRFIRNALLSLTGGALLTLAGTSGATAQTVGDQGANIGNDGTSAAATGGNGGTGNAADSEAAATQGDGGTNGTTAANNSGGSSDITTGDATSVGNQATNQTTQITVTGSNGVVQIIDQSVVTTNTGSASSNTGNNTGTGNASQNNAALNQTGTGGLAVNNGTAANNSTGTSNIGTGAASAVGNQANNVVHQTANGNAVGTLGGVLIIRQDGSVANSGDAVALTGGNTATGNASGTNGAPNTATVGQTSTTGPDGLATNSGTASNTSGGSANINTGPATAIGNQSATHVIQNATGTAGGALGGVILIDQNAGVSNTGSAVANTGDNTATGNLSQNSASTGQTAEGDGTPDDPAIASNDGIATNTSDGSAGIHTGFATAIGNQSHTVVEQTANATLVGGGVILGNQNASVLNAGSASANTGFNTAVGNVSDNDASVDQTADATGAGGPAVAANFGAGTNWSDGTAGIWTGPATAIGNQASTSVNQTFNASGGDVTIVDQDALVENFSQGEGPGAVANTGGNTAVGNASDNFAFSDQEADIDGAVGIASPTNFGESHNVSDGIAEVHTGAASATGSQSTNHIGQAVNTSNGGLLIVDQDAQAFNSGSASADTGGNYAVGNLSDNVALRFQDAIIDADLDGDPAVAANFGAATNTSGGFGAITTGNATATGNDADETTTIVQSVSGSGVDVAILDQDAYVSNSGNAYADTGDNVAVGNASDNVAEVDQETDPGGGEVGSLVVSNDGLASNNSNGFGAVTTGAATATGNAATTGITQEIDLASTGDGFVLADQDAVTRNSGFADANTGGNASVGNASDNEAEVDQEASGAKDTDGDDVVISNTADVSNSSNGTAWVTTGAATATGSTATNDTTQSVTSALTGDGFLIADQYAYTSNYGQGFANTGDNTAVGNFSDNDAEVDQEAGGAKDDIDGDDVVISNMATASTASGGFGAVTTGNATATGNDSDETSTTTQAINTGIAGDGFVIGDQDAYTVNGGLAYATTGDNVSIGNASDNEAEVDQEAGGAKDVDGEDVAITNIADVSVQSDGIGAIVTGNATATGNAATSSTNQELNGAIAGDGFVIGDQYALTVNYGSAYASSGDNIAIGNDSDNEDIDVDQDAAGADDDLDADDVVVSNIANVNVNSAGTANIRTGNATATGNDSDSDTTQLINGGIAGDGFVIADQTALTYNIGAYYNAYADNYSAYPGAIALTGGNAAYGNTSENDDLEVDQEAEGADNGDLTATGDVAINNNADVTVASTGSAGISTGDADATGTTSTSSTTQVVNAGIDGDGFVVSDQYSSTYNYGFAFADSGDNYAVGNDSDNDDIEVEQDAEGADDDLDGDDVVVNNTANVDISSGGTANIATGDATAIGNDSDETSTTTQVVNAGIEGSGFVVANQSAYTTNIGYAYAYTGDNYAVGNNSDNDIDLDQDAEGSDDGDVSATGEVVVNNTLGLNIASNGSAGIATGDACAYGNEATSNTTQAVNAGIGGDGFVVSDQYSDTFNLGAANADSGDNAAIGNDSDNDEIELEQEAYGTEDGDLTAGEEVVVNNTANATIESDGSAAISTGEAAAAGNKATNNTDQSVAASIAGAGFVIADQAAYTTNYGYAGAYTGDNYAVGNDSDNDDVEVDQEATAADDDNDLTTDEEVVVNNTANLAVRSNGSAAIDTGDACACGNEADNSTSQSVIGNIGGDGFVIADQYSDTYNRGTATADTGDNVAYGNDSDNDLDLWQDAIGATDTLEADSVVANNTANATNESNGSASITTGDAAAQGNDVDNSVAQGVTANIGGSGMVITDQDAYVTNYGDGYAYTGDNYAVGNDSDNDLEVDQEATAGTGPFESAVVNNTGTGTNSSDGTANIVTGNAGALGNRAVNQGDQSVDVGGTDTGLLISDQVFDVLNDGTGTADTGDNDAYGNASDNEAELEQTADAVPADPTTPVIANNTGNAGNVSTGHAGIDTGNAAAGGNAVTNVGVQAIVGQFNGGVQLPSQALVFTNTGVGTAETGDNDATGNDSVNVATVTQTAAGEVAVNNGAANNVSSGSVDISTGDAVACGNQATNIGVQSFGAPAPAVAAPQPVSCVPDPPDCGCDDDEETPPTVEPPVVPPVKPPVTPPTKKHEVPGGGALARTGSDIGEEALFGLFLLMAGAASRRQAKRVTRKRQ